MRSERAAVIWPIRRHLFALTLAILLPAIVFAGFLVDRAATTERERLERRLTEAARELTAALDRDFADILATARVLAGSENLAAGYLEAFHRRAVEAQRVLGAVNISVRDAASRQLINTNVPWGEALPASSRLAGDDRRAVETGGPVFSDVFIGLAEGQPQFAVVLPLPETGDAGAPRFLSLSVPLSRVGRIVEREVSLAPGMVLGVVDRAGRFVARRPDVEGRVGQPSPNIAAIGQPRSGTMRGLNAAGQPSLLAFRWSEVAGWRVGVSIPETALRGVSRRALLWLGLGGLATLLLALGAATLMGRRISAAIEALSDAAAALGRGEAVPPPKRVVGEVSKVADALADAAAALRSREVALRQSTAQLRIATEGAGVGTWDLDLRTGQGGWSTVAAALLGVERMSCTRGDYLDAAHPDDRARVDAALRRSIEEGVPYEVEFRALAPAPGGAERWLLSRGQVERDGAGAPLRVAGVLLDISALRRAEEALRHLNEGLEQRVREEVAARQQAQGLLAHAQRMEALGQLAGGIAHDLNNVLQAVSGGAALIERRPEDAAGVRRLARMVKDASERGSAVTRRLLAFGRRGDLRTEPVDAPALLADLCEVLSHTLGMGIEVRVEAEIGLPLLLADRSQLETVLVNLAANGRDAMGGRGTLTLAAAEDAGEGAPVPLAPGRYLRVRVSDRGAGMDAATLARATEPFFTTKGAGEGTGLGLAMARGFAEQSGGALGLASSLGEGTTVSLWLPVAPHGAVAAMAPSPAAAPGPGARRLVLLVDDDASVRSIMAEGLAAAGYTVEQAGSGTAALAALDGASTPDLLVSDLSMPGMDGLALIRDAQRRRPGLPAILLTGYATEAVELALGSAVAGTLSLLRKPVSTEALAERIAVMLQAKSA